MEAINQRGIGIDVAFAERAAALAAEDRRAIAKRLTEITSGAVTAVTQVARLANWIHSVLARCRGSRHHRDRRRGRRGSDGEGEAKTAALTLQRGQIAKLTAYLVTKREREGLSETRRTGLRGRDASRVRRQRGAGQVRPTDCAARRRHHPGPVRFQRRRANWTGLQPRRRSAAQSHPRHPRTCRGKPDRCRRRRLRLRRVRRHGAHRPYRWPASWPCWCGRR